jgi:[ribosomal protein S18]-alanine N-acetyltransferase
MEPANQQATSYTIRPMSDDAARAIAGWKYPPPYNFYDAIDDPVDLAELLNPDRRRGRYFEVVDGAGELAGFFEYKHEVKPLEIGLGMRPDLTGRGLGLNFVRAGMAFAQTEFSATSLSLAVVVFNERARKVYECAGFRPAGRYLHRIMGTDHEFLRMIYDPS